MTLSEALVQLKAFARIDGFILAVVWTLSFVAVLVNPGSVWGSMLAIATPFVVAVRLRKFRNYALEGSISFRRGLLYSWYTFFYASVAFALVQYVYFQYLDHGHFLVLLSETCKALEQSYQAQGLSTQELKASVSMMESLSPVQTTFLFLTQNIFLGSLLSLPIAAICRRGMARNNQIHL